MSINDLYENNKVDIYYCPYCKSKYYSISTFFSHLSSSHKDNNDNKLLPSFFQMNMLNPVKETTKSIGYLLNFPPYLLSQDEFSNYQKVLRNKKPVSLGCGAYGDVYLVYNTETKSNFAMKQFNKLRLIGSESYIFDLIKREVQIHSQLYHKNIIHLIGLYEDKEFYYIILEYANNGNLYEYIQKKKITNEYQCFKIFYQICLAIEFLHENNLIHRDIKPENILLNDNEVVKLCDFGCCNENLIENRSTFCGTVEYMAPEIKKELSYNKSVDIWSIGVLLYEMSHGYTPFNMKSNGNKGNNEVIKDIIYEKLEFNSKFLSPEGRNLILKMMVYNPNQRIKIKDIFKEKFIMKYEEKYKREIGKCVYILIKDKDNENDNKIQKFNSFEKKKEKEIKGILKKNNSSGKNLSFIKKMDTDYNKKGKNNNTGSDIKFSSLQLSKRNKYSNDFLLFGNKDIDYFDNNLNFDNSSKYSSKYSSFRISSSKIKNNLVYGRNKTDVKDDKHKNKIEKKQKRNNVKLNFILRK